VIWLCPEHHAAEHAAVEDQHGEQISGGRGG
jgi:hypothetical protein